VFVGRKAMKSSGRAALGNLTLERGERPLDNLPKRRFVSDLARLKTGVFGRNDCMKSVVG
jgi:hypothetical protein